MQFSWLEGVSKKWKEILVIGRTFEHDGKISYDWNDNGRKCNALYYRAI